MEGYFFVFTIWPLAVSQISFENDVPPRTLESRNTALPTALPKVYHNGHILSSYLGF